MVPNSVVVNSDGGLLHIALQLHLGHRRSIERVQADNIMNIEIMGR
jgi:hypothetical protein